MASATVTAVLKSGLRSSSTMTFSSAKRPGPSRSISPPLGMRPVVGTPWVTDSALPCEAKPVTARGPCATE
jgi:hypothetical protein